MTVAPDGASLTIDWSVRPQSGEGVKAPEVSTGCARATTGFGLLAAGSGAAVAGVGASVGGSAVVGSGAVVRPEAQAPTAISSASPAPRIVVANRPATVRRSVQRPPAC